MPTEKQINANRQNSLKSTGPKTPAGKSVASQNSLKHGLLTNQSTIPGESKADFQLHRDQIFSEYDPSGPTETFLTERIVLLSWRLQRVNRLQTAAAHNPALYNRYVATERFMGHTFTMPPKSGPR